MGKTRLGLKARLYVGGDSTSDECKLVKEQLTLTLTKSEADVTPLHSEWEIFRGAVKNAELSFQILDKESNSDVTAFRNSFMLGTALEVYALNGAINIEGSEGLHGMFEVMQFNRTSNNKEGSVYDVVLKPTEDTEMDEPEWHVVPAQGGG